MQAQNVRNRTELDTDLSPISQLSADITWRDYWQLADKCYRASVQDVSTNGSNNDRDTAYERSRSTSVRYSTADHRSHRCGHSHSASFSFADAADSP